jgi:carboxylate-amine ligase
VAPAPQSRELSGKRLRALFDAQDPLTVGIEEEVMLLDPESLDLAPCAAEALRRLAEPERFKPELPASQLEILTPPLGSATEATSRLAEGRRDLVAVLGGLARPAAVAVHPFAAAEGELSAGKRYGRIRTEFGRIAHRQLVASLQVHVAVGGADRTLAVYNALRSQLPEIAALAANGAFYEGRDSGMASVRPKIAELLPRQGLPPAIPSWDWFAAQLRWGIDAGVTEPRTWWWELRPHPTFGTLEVRVPDAQTTLREAGAIVALVQALVARLSERHDAGEEMRPAPRWRIEENRWSAARHGVEGQMADLQRGGREPTRERLARLIEELRPVGEALGSAPLLQHAAALVRENGALRQRAVSADVGAFGLTEWIADRFAEPLPSQAGAG